MAKQVVKVVVSGPDGYCFSRKRAPRAAHKDGLLELFGGGVDAADPSLEAALARELREEEASGELAASFEALAQSGSLSAPTRVAVRGVHHAVFRLTVSAEVAASLRACESESRGLEWVAAQELEEPARLRETLTRYTPKTRGIFAALGMV